MDRKIILALLTFNCLLTISGHAQRSPLSISAGVNYGSYSMNDMRDFQEYLRFYDQYTFHISDFKSTVEFPAQLGYEASILTSIKKWKLGLTGWRYSTGARNDYEDYTGFMRMDMITTVNGVGAKTNYTFNDSSKHQFYATLHAGMGFNKLTINHHLLLHDIAEEEEEIKFKSHNIAVAPGVGYRFSLSGHFFLTSEVRYEFNVMNSKLKQYQGYYLTSNRNDSQELQWDGFRLCLNVGYEF